MAATEPAFEGAFLRAYRTTEGKAARLCLGCHAPNATLAGDLALHQASSRDGVGCEACHRVGGVDLDAPGRALQIEKGRVERGPRPPGQAPGSPHGVVESRLHTQALLCAGCHQYRNPSGVAVLNTYEEWKGGPAAEVGKACQACHMPSIEGTAVQGSKATEFFSHEAAGGHFASQLEKAVRVTLAPVEIRGDRGVVEAKVENFGSGHRVPTGIPSRRLILEFEARTPRSTVYREQRLYERVLADATGGVIDQDERFFLEAARELRDTRLKPGEVRKETFEFPILKPGPMEVEAKLIYLYRPRILEPVEMRVEIGSAREGTE